MICTNCQTPNRQEARFCKRCGFWLAPSCPFCKAMLPEAALYCDQCGRQIAGQPALAAHPFPTVADAQPAWTEWAGRDLAGPESAGPESVGSTLAPPSQAPVNTAPSPAAPLLAATKPATAPPPQAAVSQLEQFVPKELLTKLDAARASGEMVGERRVVTMLFCDVKGSTAAAEHLDPEDWTEIINGAFEHMIRPVYKYEGTLARLMGDAILAFFGAPISHEDDPQRAILAGLDIVTAIAPYREQMKLKWGIDLNIRVGINTGLVVVGAVGSDLRMEYSALGDAVNLASRMEQTAQPGTVQIAHDTYRSVKDMFEFEALGGIEVKGKAEPVPSYRVLGRKTQMGRQRGIEGLHAEMVGREAELLALRNVITDVKQGVGRIVCVLGEAGLGKSRLIVEAHKVFKDLVGSGGNWYETGSLSYETSQAYGLFQRLIRRVHGINYDDPSPVVREKLAAWVDSLPEQRRPRAMQVFAALFGLENEGPPLDGDTFKRELVEVMVEWWRTGFADRPTVLVFDDMHWGDAVSIELLRHLLSLTEELPLVLLCALRSERLAPAWQLKTVADEEFRHRYTELTLRPLSEAESNELLSRLLAIADLPDRLRASVLEKSGGNPFFIEEVVRTLIDSGAVVAEERMVDGAARRYWRATSEGAEFAIPDNLQSLLAARMDRLEEATRGTLQVASVIGRSFYQRVLRAVDEAGPELDRRLGTLVRLDLIREAARVPEVEYAFRNPLTQEAVYKTILLKRRRAFHGRVGEAIEGLYRDRMEGFFGLLAHHFTLAGQREKAIAYSRLASQQAVALYAYDEALQNLNAALALMDVGEQSEIHRLLLEESGDVYQLLRDLPQAIALYGQALDLWRILAAGSHPAADALAAVRLHRKIVQLATEAKWNMRVEDYRQTREATLASRDSLEQSLEAMADEPPHAEAVRGLAVLSFDAWRNQMPPDWEKAQHFAQLAVDRAEQLDHPVVLSRALGALANVLDGRSRLRDHLLVAQRRLEVSQDVRVDDAGERIDALSGAGIALMYVGEYEQAMASLRDAETLAAKVQAIGQQTVALGLQGQCWFRLDRWEQVLATEEKWRDLERRYSRSRVGATCFFVALSASVHALRGDMEQASLYAKESYDYMVSVSGAMTEWQRNQFY